MESPEEIPPLPVAPLPAWRRFVGGMLAAGTWVALGWCVLTLVRPRILVQSAGDQTTIRVAP